jgi:hypothetical protein
MKKPNAPSVASSVQDEKKNEEAKTSGESPLVNVMTKIKNAMKQKQIRIEEFFIDYDPLRKGDVNRDKFKGCLDNFKYF